MCSKVCAVQPDDMSRVGGVNSFALYPMFGGKSREDVAQQRGHRMPASPRQEKGTHSGLWLAAVDPDASVTVSGAESYEKDEAAGRTSSEVKKNAGVSGEVLPKRFGECVSSPTDIQALVNDAAGYADRYALGAGFRRRASRVGVPNGRAAWFARDVPESMKPPTWRLCEAVLSFCGGRAKVRVVTRIVA